MSGWEYKVMPAPTRGLKGKGIKGAEGRFANAIEVLMNEMSAGGWEFQRAETLPSTERVGLTGSASEWRNLLVFRRKVKRPVYEFEPELLPSPAVMAAGARKVVVTAQSKDDGEPQSNDVDEDGDGVVLNTPDREDFDAGPGAREMLPDNGVEETSEVSGMTASLQKLAAQRKAGSSDP